jgi:hypothetical protein
MSSALHELCNYIVELLESEGTRELLEILCAMSDYIGQDENDNFANIMAEYSAYVSLDDPLGHLWTGLSPLWHAYCASAAQNDRDETALHVYLMQHHNIMPAA